MNYAIIENNRADLQRLEQVLSQCLHDGELVFTAATVAQSIDSLSANPALDLIFMDVELDDGTCFDIFQKLMVDTPIIFTTVYEDYVFKAFKVNCVEYLLKPITPEMIDSALRKYQLLFTDDKNIALTPEISTKKIINQ